MTELYCNNCDYAITLHADGSCACSCDFLDAESEDIPDAWISLDQDCLVLEQIRDLRRGEKDYQRREV